MPTLSIVNNRLHITNLSDDIYKQLNSLPFAIKINNGTAILPFESIPEVKGILPETNLDEEAEKRLKYLTWKNQQIYFIKNNNNMDLSYLKDIVIPIKNPKLLRPYQIQAIVLILAIRRILLADDMGLGKGIISIAATQSLKQKGYIKRTLIVCPNSIKESVWEKEINKWTDEKYIISVGTQEERKKQFSELLNNDYFYFVINYEALRKYHDILQQWNPQAIILDECTAIKNKMSKQTKAVKKFIFTPYKILLTGTPMLNRPDELWSLLNFINPYYWNSYKRFMDIYSIRRLKEIWIKKYDPKTGEYYKKKQVFWKMEGFKNLSDLRQRIEPYYRRKTKAEVAKSLPDVIEEERVITLLPKQYEMYQKLYDEMVIKLQEQDLNPSLTGGFITKFLEVCDSLALINDEEDISSKLDEAVDIIRENIDTHKIVVFSWFKKTLKLLETRLNKHKIPIIRIDGETPLEERTNAIDIFHKMSEPKVFCTTISISSFGIDLTPADICLFLSRSYTPSTNEQAISRLHRASQKNPVNVITFITEGTAEERVSEILRTKKDLFKQIFSKQQLKDFVKFDRRRNDTLF